MGQRVVKRHLPRLTIRRACLKRSTTEGMDDLDAVDGVALDLGRLKFADAGQRVGAVEAAIISSGSKDPRV